MFKYPAGGKHRPVQLLELRQGTDTAADFAIKFHTLAAQSIWNETALVVVFREGFNRELKAEMACRDNNVTLSQYTSTAICLDNQRCQHRTPTSTTNQSQSEESTEPMQLGRSRISEGEHERRYQLCFYCRQPGQRIFQCPAKPTTSQVEVVRLASKVSLPLYFLYNDPQFLVTALIDSVSALNLNDCNLVHQLGLATTPCIPPLTVTAIDDQPIVKGLLTHRTSLIEVQIGLFH